MERRIWIVHWNILPAILVRMGYFHSITSLVGLITFFSLVSELEDERFLDPDNETDLFCLHYAATDLLRRSLEGFRSAWNNHPLRTERNFSPNMLYEAGLAMLSQEQQETNEPITELQQVGGSLLVLNCVSVHYFVKFRTCGFRLKATTQVLTVRIHLMVLKDPTISRQTVFCNLETLTVLETS